MPKKHSTSALTKEDHEKQDKLYAKRNKYDYLIIGSGSAALTLGTLLANTSKKICILEAHDTPGGYAHTFKMGDFSFCAQVHYIWGCGPGEKVYEFLKRIGLEKDITFELYDGNGYDRMVMPDGKAVKIPYGYDKLAENIEKAYPGQLEPVKKFLKKLTKIGEEMKNLPSENSKWWDYIPVVFKIPNLIKYRNATLQNLFDECGLSKEAQAILDANAGDLMAPPNKLSIFAYNYLFGGYNRGAYYPTKHFKYYIDRLVKFITDHEGCHIYRETEVNKINIEDGNVTSVETKDGKKFTAENYICNMDPQKASHMIGRDKFPKSYLKSLDYEYSPSGVMVYLGLKNLDLRKLGFGGFNTWHLEQWDMNKMWEEQAEGNFEKPWVFMSTPTLHTKEGGTAPEGMHVMEVASYIEYQPFKSRQERSYNEYNKFKNEIADKMLDIVEKNYIPNLRDHIAVKVVGTPVTNEDFCMATRGNAYGSILTPKNIGLGRLSAKTPFKNFHWCNASSGGGGIFGTVSTGVDLYMDLTKDHFFKSTEEPSDQEAIEALPKSAWQSSAHTL